jgi:hypothetical protein
VDWRACGAHLYVFEHLYHVTRARVHRPGARRRVALSALVLTPSPAAPAPATPHGLTGYEPQRLGVLGDEQPVHFTIEEIPRIPSRSNRSPEPRTLAKRIACNHPRSPRAFAAPRLRRTPQSLRACSDTVRPCHGLRTLVQVVLWPTIACARRRRFICARRRLRRPSPCRATPPASRQRDSRAFPAAPQLPRRPAARQRIGTTAESTAVWQRLHRS